MVWLSARWTFGPTFIDREIGRSVVQGRGEERVTSLRTSACEARLPYSYLVNTTKKKKRKCMSVTRVTHSRN